MMVAAFHLWFGKAHGGDVERGDVREELGLERCGNVVLSRQQQTIIDRNLHIDMQLVAEPESLGVNHFSRSRHMLGGVMNLVDKAGHDAIQHARQHGACRFPDDTEDGDGDQKADDPVR